jgi:4,5-dihydroxyphthalate decarboxylase
VIADEYDVRPDEMEWFVERLAGESHGEATGFIAPPGVRIHDLRPEQNLGEMLVARELDALFHYIPAHNRIDRSRLDLRTRPEVGPLFPDPGAEGRRFYRATGMYPVNHCVIVRRSVIERHPWVGLAIYDAFVAAKDQLDAQGLAALHPFFSSGLLPKGTRDALAQDPWAYGMRNSRSAVETIERYLFEQGLLDRRINVEELFLPASLST